MRLRFQKSNILSGLCPVFVCLSWSLSWFSLFLDQFYLRFLVYDFLLLLMELYQLCLISEIGLVVHLSSVFLSVLGPFLSVCFGCSVRVLVYRRDTKCKAVT